MKKTNTYTIIVILLLIVAITGSTYAYFSAMTNSGEAVKSNSTELEVIYQGDTQIDENDKIDIVANREKGRKKIVNIAVSEDSVEAKSTIYLNIEELTENLRIKGFIWEVSGIQNGKEVYSDKGSFYGYNDTTNNIIEIVKDYRITKDNTQFTIYFWIDGNQTDNSVIGGSLKGYIGAKTENFTGEL